MQTLRCILLIIMTPQFGLIAEEAAKVDPDLVVCDKEGKPYTVRYDAVNAMLLNEFLKEYRKNEQQEASITQLRKELQRWPRISKSKLKHSRRAYRKSARSLNWPNLHRKPL